MSFNSVEQSTEASQPYELYIFTQSAGYETYTVTNAQVPIEYDGHVYEPAAITRSSPKISQQASSGQINITFPKDHPYVSRYAAGQPPLPDSCIIYRGHSTGDPGDVVIIFSGDVNGVVFEKDTAKVSLATLHSRIQRQIPKRTFSWSCNHVLYDSKCQQARANYQANILVSSVSADGLELGATHDPAWAGTTVDDHVSTDIDFFAGGLLKWSGPRGLYSRTIINFDSLNVLSLNLPLEGVEVGDQMQIFAGCNHSVFTCRDKFANVQNYGGFPFVPTSNPFADGINNDFQQNY